jgi:hypothetical protein
MILEDLLVRAGLEYKTGSSRLEVVVCCPFCIKRGYPVDTKYHLGLNLETGKAHCFRCHWKSGTVRMTIREICNRFGMTPVYSVTDAAKPKKMYVDKTEVLGLPPEYERFRDDRDTVEKQARLYLKKRGIDILQVVRHKIGYAAVGPMAWRILFPVFGRDKEVHGCVGRAFVPSMEPKYLNTPGIKMLWGADRDATTAVIVEGVVDALTVERALLQMGRTIAVARLGSTITDVQLNQLKEYDRLVILPDHDKAGIIGALALVERCMVAGMKPLISIPDQLDDRDPGDMSDEEILENIRLAVPWSKVTEWKMRIVAAQRVFA